MKKNSLYQINRWLIAIFGLLSMTATAQTNIQDFHALFPIPASEIEANSSKYPYMMRLF